MTLIITLFLIFNFFLLKKLFINLFKRNIIIISILINIIFLFISYSINIDEKFYIYYSTSVLSLNLSIYISLIIDHIKHYLNKTRLEKINKFIDKYWIYFLLLIFFILINYITFSKHLNFSSNAFDLWIFDQVAWKYSNFDFPPSSSIRMIDNILWDHFKPILFIYWLLYNIYPSPLILIFLQNLFFILWAYWIYKIINHKINNPLIWILFIILYLSFIWNINALLFDFHPMVIAVSMFPWLFYFSITKKWLYFYLLIIPILFTKENMSLYIMFFWIYQFLFQKERIKWSITFLIWVIYFYFVMNVFIPYMWWTGKSYWSYDLIWNNPKELIINTIIHPINFLNVIFSEPQKIITYLHYLWSGLLFAINPIIILLIPSFAQKFLSTRQEFWWLNFHYSIDVYWVIIIWIIYFLFLIKKKYNKNYKEIWIIIVTFIFINSLTINIYNNPLSYINYNLENKKTLLSILKIIWPNDSVSAQNTIVPHLSHRERIYVFPIVQDSEYIILNTKVKDTDLWPFNSRLEYNNYILRISNKEDAIEPLQRPIFRKIAKINNKYQLIKYEEWILLFKKIH